MISLNDYNKIVLLFYHKLLYQSIIILKNIIILYLYQYIDIMKKFRHDSDMRAERAPQLCIVNCELCICLYFDRNIVSVVSLYYLTDIHFVEISVRVILCSYRLVDKAVGGYRSFIQLSANEYELCALDRSRAVNE